MKSANYAENMKSHLCSMSIIGMAFRKNETEKPKRDTETEDPITNLFVSRLYPEKDQLLISCYWYIQIEYLPKWTLCRTTFIVTLMEGGEISWTKSIIADHNRAKSKQCNTWTPSIML